MIPDSAIEQLRRTGSVTLTVPAVDPAERLAARHTLAVLERWLARYGHTRAADILRRAVAIRKFS